MSRSRRATSGEDGRAGFRTRSLLPWLVLAVVFGPLLIGGFPDGHDWSFELVRIVEYREALLDGQLPPAWAPDLYGGYGSPIFLFYAPAYSFLAALLTTLLGSVPAGAVGALLLFGVAAVPATGRMSREVAGADLPEAPRVAFYLLLLNPYLLGDLLLRNADAEFAALCLAPLAVAGLLASRDRPRHALPLLAAGLAALILIHNLTALAFAGLLVAGAPLAWAGGRDRRRWIALGGGTLLGLAMAAFFWVPALVLTPLVRTSELLTGKFDFRGQFPSPHQLFAYDPFYGTGLLVPLILALGIGVAARAVRRRSTLAPLLVGVILASVVLVFLATSLSLPLWEGIPLLPFFQFPWRMLGPLAVVISLLGVLLFAEIARGRSRRARLWMELAVVALCLANAGPRLLDYRPLAQPVRAGLEEQLRPETIRRAGHSATVGDEYLPRAADDRVWRERRRREGPVVASTVPVRLELLGDRGTRSLLRIEASRPARLELARWTFPGWRALVNGRPAPLETSAHGSIEVAIPAGESRLELTYRSPLIRRVTSAVSGAAVVLWLVLLWRRRRKRRPG